MQELTAQMEKFREQQRNQTLMEEELNTLAATLGRVQLEKNQVEKECVNIKNHMDKIQINLKIVQVGTILTKFYHTSLYIDINNIEILINQVIATWILTNS